jgi:hypothetical protein
MRRASNLALLSIAVLLPAVLGIAPASGQSPSPGASPPPSGAPSPVPSGAPVTSAAPSAVPGTRLGPGIPVAWVALDAAGPAARGDHTLTVDGTGSAAWLFGGRDGRRTFGDLWRLDLATDAWERVEPPGDRPPERFGHSATWVPGLGLVIFGGQAGATFFADLWAFDPDARTWTALPGDGRPPEPRYGTCAALGPDGRLWISHGFTGSGRFDDTRAWHPSEGRWARVAREGDVPVERCLHACLWSLDGRLLLLGGQTNGVASLGDLWALDPIADAWTRLPDPPPGPRRLVALGTDGPGAAWLFGGSDERDRPLADLWQWDLGTLAWTRIVAEGESGPGARSSAAIVADAARGRLLLFGGEGREGRLADLWALTAER